MRLRRPSREQEPYRARSIRFAKGVAEDAKVSFVDARDIAAVAVKALVDGDKYYNKTYMITGPEALSYHEAAEILSNATGKKIDYVNISDEEARGAMKEAGLDDWLINTISDLYKYFSGNRGNRLRHIHCQYGIPREISTLIVDLANTA